MSILKFCRGEEGVTNAPHEVPKIPTHQKRSKNILLLPGHTEKVFGCKSYNGVEEHFWNRLLIDKIMIEYTGTNNITSPKEIYRGEGEKYTKYCKAIANFSSNSSIDLVIELHLNAAGIPEAKGCEALVCTGDDISAYHADRVSTYFSNRFSIAERGNYKGYRGVKGLDFKERGYTFVNSIYRVGKSAIIWEPFFCDYQTRDSKQFLSAPSFGTERMADFWIETLRHL